MSVFHRKLNDCILACFFTLIFCHSGFSATVPTKSEENGYIRPFKIFDNIYYVGDKWVSSYVITTDDGLILVDTLEYPYTHWLPGNLKQLGFNPSDIKIIIITHGHSDHASGAGWLEKLTGATLIATAESSKLMTEFFQSKPDIVAPTFKTVKLVTDSEIISLGTSQLIVHTTPGHTLGAISIQLQAKKRKQSFNSLIFGGVGTNYQTMAQADKYLESVIKLQKLHRGAPFYINLANHPHRAKLFEKIKGRTDASDPLVDSSAFSIFLKQLKSAGELRRREIAYKENYQN